MKSYRTVAITAAAVLLLVFLSLTALSVRAGEIHDAAAAGDLYKVKALLEADPTLLESKDDRLESNLKDNTPLISACWGPGSNNWQATVANYLIDKGANINAKNDRGATPLYFALKDFDLTQRLIAKGADVNIRAFGDYTPLHQAALSGNLRVTKLLIDHGADPNANGSVGTVLQFMIGFSRPNDRPNEQMAKLLVENGAKLGRKSSLGNTELHLAALKGSADWTRILAKLGADVDAVNEYGHTPLYYAAKHGYRQAADVLIAAGANQNAILETNYGKAPQLTEKLKQGEAYLWYLGGTESPYAGYAVKTKEHLLLFNPPEIDDSPEAGLANGHLNPNELADQKITALILYPSYQGRSARPSISELVKKLPGINVVLNFKPTADNAGSSDFPPYHLATPHESFSVDGVQVHTIPAVRKLWFSSEGLGYLVDADGVKIFHAGAHASSNEASESEKYHKEIDFLKPFGPIDIAILPVNGRHMWWIDYQSYLYLVDKLSPKVIYLIGDDLAKDEHRKCIEVLRARNIPVAYPEGGIAVGERFHYLRDRAQNDLKDSSEFWAAMREADRLRDPKQALEVLETARRQFPGREFEITWKMALTYAQLGQYEKSMEIWEAGNKQGLFYGLSELNWKELDWLKPLEKFPQFQSIFDRDKELREKAKQAATMRYEMVTPAGYSAARKYPLFIVLHGGGDSADRARWYWRSSTLNREYLAAYIQSPYPLSSKTYGWRGYQEMRIELRKLYDEIVAKYSVDMSRVLIGGMSAGGRTSLDAVFHNVLPVTEFVVNCPVVPDDFEPAMADQIRQRGVRGVIITGEKDFALSRQKEMVEAFKKAGVEHQFTIIPGMGHDVPDDFPSRLDAALSEVGGSSAAMTTKESSK